MFKKFIIKGCESRGDKDSAYLTRYHVLVTKWFRCYLHIFHRSDADEHHDHPWNFVTIILWRGYIEEVGDKRTRVWPLQVLRRPAEHTHRVILIDEKPAVTLVFTSKWKRRWGFVTKDGWKYFKDYFTDNGC